ncbi:MAG: family 16 glycosylhydrolase [Rhodoluna sp.]
MRLTKSFTALLCAMALCFNLGLSAEAVTVPKASSFKVSNVTSSSAGLSWAKFPTGKITGIRVQAQYGPGKKTKTLPASATSYTFTGLTGSRTYTFTIQGLKGSAVSAVVSVKATTKKALLYNSIFFGQPSDMTVGDADQELFALPNGGIVTFSTTTPTKCQIVENLYLKALALGDCVVIASNPGDATYAAAQSETRTVSISAPIGQVNKTLLWSDEFNDANGTGPNSSDWSLDLGDGCGKPPGCGWGNGESQSYAACAMKQFDGSMVITASRPTGDPSCTSNKTWTSGKFVSKDKRSFSYGYFESRMKLPAGGGTWPAFWLLGANIDTVPWPRSGEIDIMEYAGNNPNRATSAIHYANSVGAHEYKAGGYNSPTLLSSEYHTYGLLWLPNEVSFYVDGKLTTKFTKSDTGLTRWPFGPNSSNVDPKMYLIFNLAMGGNYGGSIDPGLTKGQLFIDYVRYYNVDGYGTLY